MIQTTFVDNLSPFRFLMPPALTAAVKRPAMKDRQESVFCFVRANEWTRVQQIADALDLTVKATREALRCLEIRRAVGYRTTRRVKDSRLCKSSFREYSTVEGSEK